MLGSSLIEKIAREVKQKFEGEGTGHDWWHIYRVWKMAMRIGEAEKADMSIVNLGALLHDIADWKFHDGDDSVGPKAAREMLERHDALEDVIQRVCAIVGEVSFKGAGVETKPSTLEGEVVQDADRLDALGAIGIARAFAYGGYAGRTLYNPDIKPVMHKDKESYSKSNGPTINHFYEKLLLLKDRMNTKTGRAIAEERHVFLETYLELFYREWEGRA
jgi:uncharacterized protein